MEFDELSFIPVIDQDGIDFAPNHLLVRARVMPVRIFGADDARPLSGLVEDLAERVIRGRRPVPPLISIEIVQPLPRDDALVGAIGEIVEVSKQGPRGFTRVRVGGGLRLDNGRRESEANDPDNHPRPAPPSVAGWGGTPALPFTQPPSILLRPPQNAAVAISPAPP